jgi:hypothetical protein
MDNADKAIHEITAGLPVMLYGDVEQNGEADLACAASLSTTDCRTGLFAENVVEKCRQRLELVRDVVDQSAVHDELGAGRV